jgi:predicted Holliday junction resolvase-like endonuclease
MADEIINTGKDYHKNDASDDLDEADKKFKDTFLETTNFNYSDSVDDMGDVVSDNTQSATTDPLGTGGYRDRLAATNNLIRNLRARRRSLEEDYEKAIDEGRTQDAKRIQETIDYLDRQIEDKIQNKLGYTASQSFAMHAKARKTDDFLDKAFYMLKATPYDSFGGNPCCFIKAFLKMISWQDDGEKTNALQALRKGSQNYEENVKENFVKDYNVQETKSVIDSIRSLLTMAYGKNDKMANQLMNKMVSMYMSPFKGILQASVNLLRELEREIIDEIKDWLGVLLYQEKTNPSAGLQGMLECYSLERVADFVFDEIEDFFDMLEENLLDLYKTLYGYIDDIDKDALVLGEKKWIKDTYQALTKISKALDFVDKINDVDYWVKELMKNNDLATRYNPDTGHVQEVDIGECIDPVVADGKSKSTNNVNKININEDKNFLDFLDNKGSVDISCDANYKKEEDVNKAKEEAEKSPEEAEQDALNKAEEVVNE